jgi:hypothetical protein
VDFDEMSNPNRFLKRLKPGIHCYSSTSISVVETAKGGEGEVTFRVCTPCLHVRIPEEPVKWLGTKSCGDSVIFEFINDEVHLHLVELKSKIGAKVLEKIKYQIHGAYLNALAISGVLEFSDFSSVTVHIAYNEDSFSVINNASPILLKMGLGEHRNSDVSDWIERRIRIQDLPDACNVRDIIRDSAGNGHADLR